MLFSKVFFCLAAILSVIVAAPVDDHPVAASSSAPSRGRAPTRKTTADRGRPQRKTTGSGSRQSNRDGSLPKPWQAKAEYGETQSEHLPCKMAKSDPMEKCNRDAGGHCGTQGDGAFEHRRNGDADRMQKGKLKMIKIMDPKVSLKKMAHEIKGLILVKQFESCQYHDSTVQDDGGHDITRRQYFLFMKKMAGVTISQLPKNPEDSSGLINQRTTLTKKITQALVHYAQMYNAAHGDVMPGNILVDGTDPEHYSVSLVDWAQWDWIDGSNSEVLKEYEQRAAILARIAVSSAIL